MENGYWKMVNGYWKMVNGKWLIVDCFAFNVLKLI